MATDPRCPDCGVTLEEHDLSTGQGHLRIKTDRNADGFFGSLGVAERLDVSPHLCPECGLVRFYADERPE